MANADEPATVEIIVSPLIDIITILDSANGPVFSSESIGKGITIKPNGNTIYYPVDGIVQDVFETGHDHRLKSNAGA
ncbi:PTS beta-glucoside transporter subunit IIBCA, partial [Enterococcus faecalis]|nr:PTS beta-glucoside transporter subunit IIBCA [Enterococcus faecalis]